MTLINILHEDEPKRATATYNGKQLAQLDLYHYDYRLFSFTAGDPYIYTRPDIEGINTLVLSLPLFATTTPSYFQTSDGSKHLLAALDERFAQHYLNVLEQQYATDPSQELEERISKQTLAAIDLKGQHAITLFAHSLLAATDIVTYFAQHHVPNQEPAVATDNQLVLCLDELARTLTSLINYAAETWYGQEY